MASETKTTYTPGPWTIWSEEGQNRAGAYLYSVCRAPLDESGRIDWDRDSEHMCVAEALGKTSEQARANSRLIAAAPELLEALRRVVTDVGGGSFRNLTGENAQLALAAIAKAEGMES